MSEWQPARFIDVHPGKTYLEAVELFKKSIIRVRPAEANREMLACHRQNGCDARADEFVEVHPDDVKRAKLPSLQLVVCKHEIVTD